MINKSKIVNLWALVYFAYFSAEQCSDGGLVTTKKSYSPKNEKPEEVLGKNEESEQDSSADKAPTEEEESPIDNNVNQINKKKSGKIPSKVNNSSRIEKTEKNPTINESDEKKTDNTDSKLGDDKKNIKGPKDEKKTEEAKKVFDEVEKDLKNSNNSALNFSDEVKLIIGENEKLLDFVKNKKNTSALYSLRDKKIAKSLSSDPRLEEKLDIIEGHQSSLYTDQLFEILTEKKYENSVNTILDMKKTQPIEYEKWKNVIADAHGESLKEFFEKAKGFEKVTCLDHENMRTLIKISAGKYDNMNKDWSVGDDPFGLKDESKNIFLKIQKKAIGKIGPKFLNVMRHLSERQTASAEGNWKQFVKNISDAKSINLDFIEYAVEKLSNYYEPLEKQVFFKLIAKAKNKKVVERLVDKIKNEVYWLMNDYLEIVSYLIENVESDEEYKELIDKFNSINLKDKSEKDKIIENLNEIQKNKSKNFIEELRKLKV